MPLRQSNNTHSRAVIVIVGQAGSHSFLDHFIFSLLFYSYSAASGTSLAEHQRQVNINLLNAVNYSPAGHTITAHLLGLVFNTEYVDNNSLCEDYTAVFLVIGSTCYLKINK